jgi:hypothetical protein
MAGVGYDHHLQTDDGRYLGDIREIADNRIGRVSKGLHLVGAACYGRITECKGGIYRDP